MLESLQWKKKEEPVDHADNIDDINDINAGNLDENVDYTAMRNLAENTDERIDDIDISEQIKNADDTVPFFPVPHAGRFRLRQRLRCLHSDAASRKTGLTRTGGRCSIRLRQQYRGSSGRTSDDRSGLQRRTPPPSGTPDSVPDQISEHAA